MCSRSSGNTIKIITNLTCNSFETAFPVRNTVFSQHRQGAGLPYLITWQWPQGSIYIISANGKKDRLGYDVTSMISGIWRIYRSLGHLLDNTLRAKQMSTILLDENIRNLIRVSRDFISNGSPKNKPAILISTHIFLINCHFIYRYIHIYHISNHDMLHIPSTHVWNVRSFEKMMAGNFYYKDRYWISWI